MRSCFKEAHEAKDYPSMEAILSEMTQYGFTVEVFALADLLSVEEKEKIGWE